MKPINQTTEKIIEVFEGFRMAPLPIDQYNQIGRAVLTEKINGFVSSGRQIDFVMLGYPMKSPNNRDKVLGRLPDMAEAASFDNFADFGNRIKEIYSPGAAVSVVSDGYVFNDLLGVEDRTVEEYGEASRAMSAGAPVKWFDIRDFYDRHSSLQALREKAMLQHGITAEELERRILMDADVNNLYRGMIRFLSLDLAIRDWPSNSQLHKAAKQLARDMMFRNEAYSRLVQSEFSSHVRLSMHPSVNNGTKFSFKLIPGENTHHSPWHATLLTTGNEFITLHRRDAEAMGADLIYERGQPWGFELKNKIINAIN